MTSSPTTSRYRFGFESGNTEEAFKKADVIVKERFINQRLAPVAMEPRGVVATYQMPDNELVVWNSTQTTPWTSGRCWPIMLRSPGEQDHGSLRPKLAAGLDPRSISTPKTDWPAISRRKPDGR